MLAELCDRGGLSREGSPASAWMGALLSGAWGAWIMKVDSYLSKPRVLIIDDDVLTGELFQRILERSGYTVSTADSGARGLELLRAGEYEILLLDLVMPRMSGLDVLAALRERPVRNMPEVVMITGADDMKSRASCRGLGVHRFLLKPVSRRALTTLVDDALHASIRSSPLSPRQAAH